MYKVYVKTDVTGRIISVNSDAFLTDTSGWTLIDEGDGDRFHHAQNNYLPMPPTAEQGVYRHKLVDGKVTERTAEEIQADIDAIPPPQKTIEVVVEEQRQIIEALQVQNDLYADLIQELAMIVYA